MTNWAYIATPYGASLHQTLTLARGNIFHDNKRIFTNCGIIFRKIQTRIGTPIEIIKQVKAGDTLLLLYDFAHAGLIFPVQQFEIMAPRKVKTCCYLPIGTTHGYDAVGKIFTKSFRQINFVPDYLDQEDAKNKIQHVVFTKSMIEQLPKDKIGKVCVREPYNNKLALIKLEELNFINQKEGEGLAFNGICAQINISQLIELELAEEYGCWPKLNGWIKKLLHENKKLEKEKVDSKNFAVEAVPLCSLFEYLLNCILKTRADMLMGSTGKPTERYIDKKGDEYITEFPVAPEDSQEDLDCYGKIIMATKLICSKGSVLDFEDTKNLMHTLRKLRNRIAHSYFIEEHHYKIMKQCIRDLLKIYCLNGG